MKISHKDASRYRGPCGAETLFRRALEAMERVLGSEHPNTLTLHNNLAVLLKAKGGPMG